MHTYFKSTHTYILVKTMCHFGSQRPQKTHWSCFHTLLIAAFKSTFQVMFSLFFFCSFCFMQYQPGQGDHALFSPPSSTSSGTDSSLRIRRSRSACTERRWFISVSLAMLITLVIASGGIYFGCKNYFHFSKLFVKYSSLFFVLCQKKLFLLV